MGLGAFQLGDELGFRLPQFHDFAAFREPFNNQAGESWTESFPKFHGMKLCCPKGGATLKFSMFQQI